MRVSVLAAMLTAASFAAHASDLPSKKMPAAPAAMTQPANNWTGAYVGITGGYAWGTTDYTSPYSDGSIDSKGWNVGGQLGYDWQLSNNFVFGVVGDLAWLDVNGSTLVEENSDPVNTSYAKANIDMLATARIRVGYAIDNILVYATGGAAYAQTKVTVTALAGNDDNYADWKDSKNILGWAIGGGLEYKVSKNASFGVEYLHVNLGSEHYDLSNGLGAPTYPVKAETSIDLVRAALNYRF